jgi:hypothetical protein
MAPNTARSLHFNSIRLEKRGSQRKSTGDRLFSPGNRFLQQRIQVKGRFLTVVDLASSRTSIDTDNPKGETR